MSNSLCPLDGYPALWEPTIGYNVCTHCSEMLTASEMVTRANRRTRREYLAASHPGASRGWLHANGWTA